MGNDGSRFGRRLVFFASCNWWPVRGSPLDDLRLDAYTATGVVGWGLSAWVATTLGMALGGLDGGWIAGWLVYLVLLREWPPSDCSGRVLKDATVTVLAVGLIAVGFPHLRRVSPQLPALLIQYLPVVTAVGGALHPRGSSAADPAVS